MLASWQGVCRAVQPTKYGWNSFGDFPVIGSAVELLYGGKIALDLVETWSTVEFKIIVLDQGAAQIGYRHMIGISGSRLRVRVRLAIDLGDVTTQRACTAYPARAESCCWVSRPSLRNWAMRLPADNG